MAEATTILTGRHCTVKFLDATGTPLTYTAAKLQVDSVAPMFQLQRDRVIVLHQSSTGSTVTGAIDGGVNAEAEVELAFWIQSDNLTNTTDRTLLNTLRSLYEGKLGGWASGVSTNPNPHNVVFALDLEITFNDQGTSATDYTWTCAVLIITQPTTEVVDQGMVIRAGFRMLEAPTLA